MVKLAIRGERDDVSRHEKPEGIASLSTPRRPVNGRGRLWPEITMMKPLAQVLFLVVGCTAVTAGDSDCDRFHLGQMHLGDTREATVARWSGKLKEKGATYKAKVPGVRKTLVEFDAAGKIEAIRMEVPPNPAAAKLLLIERFGPPTADNLQVPVDVAAEVFAGPMTHTQTRWDSPTCNVDAVLDVVSGASPGFTVTSVFAKLFRHGTHQ